MAVVKVKLTADDTDLLNGESTVVRIWAQGTAAGVYSIGGYIVATWVSGDLDILTSTALSMLFDPPFNPVAPFAPKFGAPDAAGKGGWGDLLPAAAGFGTMQTGWAVPNPLLGQADYVQICHYTVVAENAPASGIVSLGFVAKTVGGYKCLEADKTGVMGTLTPVVISVTPEPMTLALLALGGLALVRRRR
jgi:hypothetical protein